MNATDTTDDQDWRLTVELEAAPPSVGALERLVGHARGPDVVKQVGAAAPHDVVITHDGAKLFAYAANEASLHLAREAIASVLADDRLSGDFCVCHWDTELDEWRQIDPPLSGQALQREQALEHDAEVLETRTMVASAGKLVRSEVEQVMLEWADKLDLRCEITEHRHLLTSQVAFAVTGPRRKIDEFATGLRAEELATMRTEALVMASPL